MKKRILSLVLCAALLLSLCLFMGAGVVDDASDAPAESTAAAQVQAPQTVVYTAAGPFLPAVSVQPVLRAVRASGANELKDGLNLSKTATANADGSYKIRMEAFTTGKVTTTSCLCWISPARWRMTSTATAPTTTQAVGSMR